jgi:RNA polymerase sigma factor (sigma-70 family)
METLCRRYWYPLYAYVRCAGHSPADAQDLTQDFFARLLAKHWLTAADPERGRFRSLLLVAMKRHLARHWHQGQAQKRGGEFELISVNWSHAEERYGREPVLQPDAIFERRWAMELVSLALLRLEAEFVAAGEQVEYTALSAWLTAARGEIPYEVLAVQLGTSPGAARVAIHRLRKRFRQCFREAVAATVADGEDVEAEMRHLARSLGTSV